MSNVFPPSVEIMQKYTIIILVGWGGQMDKGFYVICTFPLYISTYKRKNALHFVLSKIII